MPEDVKPGDRVVAGSYRGTVESIDSARVAKVTPGHGVGLTHVYYPVDLLRKISPDAQKRVADVAVR